MQPRHSLEREFDLVVTHFRMTAQVWNSDGIAVSARLAPDVPGRHILVSLQCALVPQARRIANDIESGTQWRCR